MSEEKKGRPGILELLFISVYAASHYIFMVWDECNLAYMIPPWGVVFYTLVYKTTPPPREGYKYSEYKHGYTVLDSLPKAQLRVSNLVKFTEYR